MDPEAEIAALDETTLAVRDLINASRDLVVRMAKVMDMNPNDMTAIALLQDRGPLGASELDASEGAFARDLLLRITEAMERSGREPAAGRDDGSP